MPSPISTVRLTTHCSVSASQEDTIFLNLMTPCRSPWKTDSASFLAESHQLTTPRVPRNESNPAGLGEV